MNNNFKDAEKNLENFLEKYGMDGFLKLFYTNYLFDLVTYYIQSQDNVRERNPSYLYHFDIKGNPFPPTKIDNFNRRLKTVCSEHALKIVTSLKDQTNLADLVTNPLDVNSRKLLDDAFEKIAGRFDEK